MNSSSIHPNVIFELIIFKADVSFDIPDQDYALDVEFLFNFDLVRIVMIH